MNLKIFLKLQGTIAKGGSKALLYNPSPAELALMKCQDNSYDHHHHSITSFYKLCT